MAEGGSWLRVLNGCRFAGLDACSCFEGRMA